MGEGSAALTSTTAGGEPAPAPCGVRGPAAFPFSAIAGQEQLKLALILNAIDPLVGGVLLMGERGTGKSTAVRALARLLPPLKVVAGCRFHCDPDRPDQWCSECEARFPEGIGNACGGQGFAGPLRGSVPVDYVPTPFVDLPLGTTEDRLLGSLNLEKALREGVKAFEPGLLARAHRGFLYVDEVNLLDDGLVDRLLDAAASGWHVVERDGISLRHPARFVLVGSGNPEEGELRPQLTDRFGLSVTVTTPTDIDVRVEILRRREQFERDPVAFAAVYAEQEEELRRRIVAARRRVAAGVEVGPWALRWAAALGAELQLQGHRGELTLLRAAAALAAWEGRDAVTRDDLHAVAPLALAHRVIHDPFGADEPAERVRAAMAFLEDSRGAPHRA